MDMNNQLDVFEFFQPAGIPMAIAILVGTFLLIHVLSKNMEHLGERFQNKRLLISQIGTFFRFVLYLLGIVGALASVFQLSHDLLLAIGGTAAVSIGFALKDYVASVVAGVVILIDRPFQVGDRVSFDGYYGEVRHIGLRSVRLVTLDDNQVTIPNNKFLTDSVASGNAGAIEMMIQMDFFIGIDQDVAVAKKVVEESLTSSRFISLKLPWYVNLSETIQDNYFAIRIRARGYIADTQHEKDFETDVTERVLEGFRTAGVGPPALLHRNL